MVKDLSREVNAIRDEHGRKIYAHIASNFAGDFWSFAECYVTGTLEEYTLKRKSITNVLFFNDAESAELTIDNVIANVKRTGLKYRWNKCVGRS